MIDPHAPPFANSGVPPINHKLLSERLMGDESIIEIILMSFAANFDNQLNAIRTAVAAQDMAALNRAAHSLKGAAGNLSAETLQAACGALEKASHSNDPVAVNSCTAVLEQAASDLRSVLPT